MESNSDTAVWATPSAAGRIELPGRRIPEPGGVRSEKTLVVCGGGAMMDEAKYFRARVRPELRLTLIPSIWGSGAERSPVCVLDRGGAKEIHLDGNFLPDEVAYLPELAGTASPRRRLDASGDVWAHLVEAFVSPLASESIRGEIARLANRVASLRLDGSERDWFETGGEAARLQAGASVGLVHGIAHVLEKPLRSAFPESGWGHARICATFLAPVMDLTRDATSKWQEYCARFGVDEQTVRRIAGELHDPAAYAQALPVLEQHWHAILRDRCTRTNGAVVRPAYLEFFRRWSA